MKRFDLVLNICKLQSGRIDSGTMRDKSKADNQQGDQSRETRHAYFKLIISLFLQLALGFQDLLSAFRLDELFAEKSNLSPRRLHCRRIGELGISFSRGFS